MRKQLQAGDKAPDFKLEDQSGAEVSLRNFRGSKVLIFFYPRANTPGCTRQACSVRDASSELLSLDVVPLGISPDKPTSQDRFDQKYTLGFRLLSDPDKKVAEAYGAFGEKKAYGKVSKGIIRSSFLIDEEGKVLQATYKVKPEDTVPKAREALSPAD